MDMPARRDTAPREDKIHRVFSWMDLRDLHTLQRLLASSIPLSEVQSQAELYLKDQKYKERFLRMLGQWNPLMTKFAVNEQETVEMRDRLVAVLTAQIAMRQRRAARWQIERTQSRLKEALMKGTLTQSQQGVVDKIQALRKLTADSGFKTTRTQTELLQRLSADDLAAVATVLYSERTDAKDTREPRRQRMLSVEMRSAGRPPGDLPDPSQPENALKNQPH